MSQVEKVSGDLVTERASVTFSPVQHDLVVSLNDLILLFIANQFFTRTLKFARTPNLFNLSTGIV